ncbi:hypothetical protein ABZ806_02130 [Spirillospora sp. NPDC047418]
MAPTVPGVSGDQRPSRRRIAAISDLVAGGERVVEHGGMLADGTDRNRPIAAPVQ